MLNIHLSHEMDEVLAIFYIYIVELAVRQYRFKAKISISPSRHFNVRVEVIFEARQ